MASGIVIAGFGSGALFFTPMMNLLSAKFSKMPEYLGKSIETVTESGKMFAKIGDSMQEVVYATAADLAKLPYSDLAEGFYIVRSGLYHFSKYNIFLLAHWFLAKIFTNFICCMQQLHGPNRPTQLLIASGIPVALTIVKFWNISHQSHVR